MFAYLVKTLGVNKNALRLWLEGKYLMPAGFLPGQRYNVRLEDMTLQLLLAPDGSRVISYKEKGGSKVPIIDLNSNELLKAFEGLKAVKVAIGQSTIRISPIASELRRRERLKRLLEKVAKGCSLAIGSMSHGGGILSRAVHDGLASEGIRSHLAFANEIREDLLSQSFDKNPGWIKDSQFLAGPMQEIAFDREAMAYLNEADIMELGLPCQGASPAGKSKNAISLPEEHADVGHLLVGALAVIARANPTILLIENVPAYSTAGSAHIIRNQLRDMGYRIEERVLRGGEFGALEDRKRWVMLAVTEGIPFSFEDLVIPEKRERRLREVLEDIPADDPRWCTMAGLKAKEVRDKAAGKGFLMQVFGPDDTRIGTITKGYAKVRSTDPKIAHPTNPNLLRQLTPVEHARVKGIPTDLCESLSQTVAHEMLGQSICYEPFKAVGQLVARIIKKYAGGTVEACASIVKQEASPTVRPLAAATALSLF